MIDVTADLVELNELFKGYWCRVDPLCHSSSIALPFPGVSQEYRVIAARQIGTDPNVADI